MMNSEIFIVSLVFLGISFIVSGILKSKFTRYSKIGLANGLSGREIAEKMLRENGIYDVKVTSVQGFLSDHYNPANKTVNLSPEVYNGRSVSAAAVAAHECGHAVQHATSYGPLTFRSKLVPVVQMSSMLVNWILLAGMIVLASTKNPTVLLVGIIVMSVTVLFTLVTLPVEFDASKRALAWLQHTNVTTSEEYPKAKDALKWAATTYVVAALAAVVTLIQYVMIYLGSRDRS
ncbi:MAG TPA: zinc metallopeptidase [Chitinophagaceae bacterium]|jgi:Zn-dependent membrane protease YugP|nr:zinc metallopeptidase [Chitinophagaceae bacterium]